MFTVIAFIVVLGILVLVHELGHFISARKLGVGVEEFGIGFPPRMLKIKRKGIIYSINWIPLGGFVKIKGESGEDADDPNSFANQNIWKKTLILSAGVLMNFLLGFVFLSIAFYIGMPQSIGPDTPLDQVKNRQVVISDVLENSPADQAAIEPGDIIVSVNNKSVDSSTLALEEIKATDGPVNLKLNRRGDMVDIQVTRAAVEGETSPVIGIGMVDTGVLKYGFWQSIGAGFELTIVMIGRVFQAFYELLVNLITQGRLSAELSGPVGVAVLTGQMVRLGFVFALQFVALLSINLGVLNILPFPALDGGRLLFVWVQAIARRKMSEKVEAIIHNSGFILLVLLLIFITFKDVMKFFFS